MSNHTIDGLERYEVTVMGDINVDYLDKKELNLKHIKHMERSNGLRQLISDTTRYANRNSTLDLIFTNMDHVLKL